MDIVGIAARTIAITVPFVALVEPARLPGSPLPRAPRCAVWRRRAVVAAMDRVKPVRPQSFIQLHRNSEAVYLRNTITNEVITMSNKALGLLLGGARPLL